MKHPVRHTLGLMIASALFAGLTTAASASEAFDERIDPIGVESVRSAALTRGEVRAQTALAREAGTLDTSGEAAAPTLQVAREAFNRAQTDAYLAQIAIEQAAMARATVPMEVESYVVFEDIAPGVLVVGLNDAGHAVRVEFFRDADSTVIDVD